MAVGSYRCFMRNQWNKGIPMLALGNNPALKDLAVKELKGVTDAGEQAKLEMLGGTWREKKASWRRRTFAGALSIGINRRCLD